MSGRSTEACIAVNSFVEEWMKANHPNVGRSVFEEQNTLDICINVLLPGNPKTLALKSQQTADALDSETKKKIREWLANLPFPKSAAAS